MKKVMLLLAMLAMVLAAVVPAFAQQGIQVASGGAGDDLIQQCQNNLNQVAIAAGGQYSDNTAVNVNTGDLENNCVQVVNNKQIAQKHAKVVGFTIFKDVHRPVFFDVTKNVFFIIVNKEVVVINKDVVVFTAAPSVVQYAAPAVQYQYAAPAVQYQYGAAAELPPTGGSSLIALGAGVLLVAGGLLARRLVR